MRDTRLVFVEGVLGAGKSTTATKIIDTLTANGAVAERVSEGDERLRVTSQLEHGYTPWLDVSVHQYVARCRANWRAFMSSRTAGDTITVCDGLLFHGNLTDLILMDADAAAIASYYEAVLAEVASLRPVLIYLRVQDATRTIREACIERGQAWETRQVNWKVASPHGRAHGLSGRHGLERLYEDFAKTCDTLVAGRDLPTLRVVDDRTWTERHATIAAWLA
jgi:deoxyadenosine/deoxycytidine kinase